MIYRSIAAEALLGAESALYISTIPSPVGPVRSGHAHAVEESLHSLFFSLAETPPEQPNEPHYIHKYIATLCTADSLVSLVYLCETIGFPTHAYLIPLLLHSFIPANMPTGASSSSGRKTAAQRAEAEKRMRERRRRERNQSQSQSRSQPQQQSQSQSALSRTPSGSASASGGGGASGAGNSNSNSNRHGKKLYRVGAKSGAEMRALIQGFHEHEKQAKSGDCMQTFGSTITPPSRSRR